MRGTTVTEPGARIAATSRGVAMILPRSAISAAKCACCSGVTVIGSLTDAHADGLARKPHLVGSCA